MQNMTYILQNISILDWHEFDTEDEAREWAYENLLREDYEAWTLLDPEGGTWYL